MTVVVDEPEVPVLDVHAPAVPLVGPREDKRPGAAGCVDRPQLPLEDARLDIDAVASAVEADLGDQQRAVAGDVVEPGEIRLHRLVRFEVDVEADQIEKRQLEVFGRRVVDVGDERVPVDLLHGRAKLLDEALDLPTAVPPDDRGGDLVPDGVAEDGGMTRAGRDLLLDALDDLRRGSPFVEECNVVFPGEADHDAESVLMREIEQPRRRCRVEAHGVRAGACHGCEVAGDDRLLRIGRAVGPVAERAVGDPTDVLLLPGDLKRAPVDVRASSLLDNRERRSRPRGRKGGRCLSRP